MACCESSWLWAQLAVGAAGYRKNCRRFKAIPGASAPAEKAAPFLETALFAAGLRQSVFLGKYLIVRGKYGILKENLFGILWPGKGCCRIRRKETIWSF